MQQEAFNKFRLRKQTFLGEQAIRICILHIIQPDRTGQVENIYIYPFVVLSFKATSITTSLLKTVLRQAAEKLSKSSNFKCLTEAGGE